MYLVVIIAAAVAAAIVVVVAANGGAPLRLGQPTAPATARRGWRLVAVLAIVVFVGFGGWAVYAMLGS